MALKSFSLSILAGLAIVASTVPVPEPHDTSKLAGTSPVGGEIRPNPPDDALNDGNSSSNIIPYRFDVSNADLHVIVQVPFPPTDFDQPDVTDSITRLTNLLRTEVPTDTLQGIEIYPVNQVATYITPTEYVPTLKYEDSVEVGVALLTYVQTWDMYRMMGFSVLKDDGTPIGTGGIIKARSDENDLQLLNGETISLTQFPSEMNTTGQEAIANLVVDRSR